MSATKVTSLAQIEELAQKAGRTRIAVAAAEDVDVMQIIPTLKGEIDYILIGDKPRVEAMLKENGITGQSIEIIDRAEHTTAAALAVEMVRDGSCDIIMKGNLHTAIYFKAVLNKETGVASGSFASQVSVYDKLHGDELFFLTDCAMNIAPNLEEKVNLVNNAVALARELGVETPRVAMLSALEVVNPKIPDTMEAAVISKMADRGQIKNCIVDGPLALDNIVSPEAAAQKGIQSPVAGVADIVVAPNLQVCNALHKAISYFGGRASASVIAGTRVPVVSTSRTDSVPTKLLTLYLAIYRARQGTA